MKKNLISFIKSEVSLIVAFLLSDFFLILFYSIAVRHQVEVFYPLVLSLFVLLCYEGFRFYRFLKKHRELERMVKIPGYDAKETDPFTVEVNHKINQLHNSYLHTIYELNQKQISNQRFSSALIHNMKTPIAVSSLVLQRLNRKEITGEEACATLEEENQKLLTALNNVLELQRFEEAVNDYQPKSISLSEEVRELINENRSLFIQNHVFPKLEVQEDGIVLADKRWNKVMLQQLLSNAVKYSYAQKEAAQTSKSVTFTIQKEKNEDHTVVKLFIQDEGIGIPEYDLPRVFEPFYTGDNGRKHYNSSGIGLYLCQQIATLMKAKLEIQSKSGTGTTIMISYLTKL
ncbi:MAG: HAMP domain-containing sensor histidine kinase [Clostridiales bacterium]|nr:HAMP domain-containing sensor histidine kinase [Clostridiales bacterium]